MQQYNPVTPEILTELKAIVGEKYAFSDPDKLETYSRDETPDSKYAHLPEVVVLPGTTEEVAHVVKLANRERISIVPRGAGTGLACGAVPVTGTTANLTRTYALTADPGSVAVTGSAATSA